MLADIEKQQEETPKYTRWFNKVAIWELNGEEKSHVAQTVLEELNTGTEYWSLMFLSIIIATL